MTTETNPYAAPSGPALAQGQPSDYWNPQNWEVNEVLSTAWERFKKDWAPLLVSLIVGFGMLLVPLVLMFVLLIPIMSDNARTPPGPGFAIGLVCGYVAILALGQLVQAGWLAVFTASARGESPTLQVFFGGMPRFLALLGEALLYSLAVGLGTLCFIVPGVVLGLGLSLGQYYVGEGLGPIDSLQASWKATTGERWKLLLLYVALFLIIMAGEMACGVGLLIAGPVTLLARALVFVRLSGRTASAVGLPQGA